MNKIIFTMLLPLLVLGCAQHDEPEKHQIFNDGIESGVRLEVLLKNGGTAVFVCPKYTRRPRGAHGRECYIERYEQ